MGVVYRATDLRLNRDVALKVLPDDLVHDPDRRRRFVQEAQAASALEHPHIASPWPLHAPSNWRRRSPRVSPARTRRTSSTAT